MNKFEICCLLEAIKSFAYDMHYQAKGSLFYNDHLFAEKISDIYDRDDFIETFFLGEFESAPTMREIYQKTIELTPAILDDMSKNYDTYLRLSAKALLEIENFDGSKAEQDILGKIAYNLQKYSGLVWRELLESGISEDNKIDYVMKEFAEGKLKDPQGNTVTNKKQALAIAYSEAAKE